MSQTLLIIMLSITGAGAIAISLLAIRKLFVRNKDRANPRVKRNKELIRAAESLEYIANTLDEWVERQRDKFRNTTTSCRKKWISRWFSDFLIMKLFRDKVHKSQFADIVDTLRLYIPNLAEPLKEIRNNFLHYSKRMRQIQRDGNGLEDNHNLGFWCVNFLDTIAAPTVEDIRHIAEMAREYLAAQERAETAQNRPMEVLNEQVAELLSSSGPGVSASEIACKLNERYFGKYKSISACLVGKTENWKRHRDQIEDFVEG